MLNILIVDLFKTVYLLKVAIELVEHITKSAYLDLG